MECVMSESLAYTEAAARLAEERVQFDASQHQWDQAARDRLVSAGFSGSEAQTAVGILRSHPEAGLKIAAALPTVTETIVIAATAAAAGLAAGKLIA
jgi:hypothetical protein